MESQKLSPLEEAKRIMDRLDKMSVSDQQTNLAIEIVNGKINELKKYVLKEELSSSKPRFFSKHNREFIERRDSRINHLRQAIEEIKKM